ncbi:peptide MFS transporter [Sphingomonas bacterium]|uniref:peptide MFS transporter n=1 Tax=Sphingomonas bacterium TaxID=1895847 RepID=UPI00262549C3|nr:oligopeptide:H+ symporter [Sphingomonas bacterium]MDB5678774.1 transporter [Sphingomonas bacterium]
MTIEEPDVRPDALMQPPHKGEFLGHPWGLPVIAGTEAFERFSYYGMSALLVLYLTSALLLPGHVEHVAGFAAFERVLTAIYGAAPNVQALSSYIVGSYTALVYVTPILGGLLADRWLGKTRTVTLGALLMSAGHFLMAFDVSFLAALLLLVIGVGCLKGNLASQVGALYGPGDNRAADGFQIYYLGISGGAFFGAMICGTLGEKVAWHWGFGAAGVGMIIGLVIYLFGRRHLPPEAPRMRMVKATAPKMAARDVKVLLVLLALIPVLALGGMSNQQMFNAYLVWANRSYDFVLFGIRWPTTYLVSFDSITGFITMAGAVLFWRWYGTRWREPDELSKIIIGCLLSSSAFILLAVMSQHAAATGAKLPLWIAPVVNTLNNIGFANVFPVSLALYSRSAPRSIAATMIGIYYLFLFGAGVLSGKVGAWLDVMPVGQFWWIHVGTILAAAVLFLVAKLLFGKLLEPVAE